MSKAGGGGAGSATRRTVLAIAAGAAIMSLALGTRQTFGLFVLPLSDAQEFPVARVALAIALHNLVWGLAQPLAGAAADRFGPAPVVGVGALLFASGLALPALAPSDLALVVGMGGLVGTGISCTSFGVVLTAVGRAARPEGRSMAMGLASAGGSLGQVLLVPLAQSITQASGAAAALLALAAMMLAAIPLGFMLGRRGEGGEGPETGPPLSLRGAVSAAGRHRGYVLLTTGFFACGFQLAFIATHLPGYLADSGLPGGTAAAALAAIGLFNVLGSWGWGWLGGRLPQQHLLGWLYLARSVAIGVFVALPKTNASVLVFAAVMGLAWLGTVPLTSALVARIFGVRHLGALFGICFMSHQAGSFLGAWLGGAMLDLTGSYGPVWGATLAAGLLAAALHFPIDARPAGEAVARRGERA